MGLTAGKQRRTVRARQHAGTNCYRAHRTCIASIDARFAVQDLRADDLGFNIAEYCFHQVDVFRSRSFRNDFRQHFGAGRINFFSAGLLLAQAIGLAQIAFRN